jgi:addiction module RelE/StbE family toxin
VKVRYTPPALADLASILDYIAARSPQGAKHVHLRIQRLIDLLSIYPHMGVRTDHPAIRRLTTSPYPYLIFYEPTETEIIIHAVRHGARNPSGMPGLSR